jgi:hypothetical protein
MDMADELNPDESTPVDGEEETETPELETAKLVKPIAEVDGPPIEC